MLEDTRPEKYGRVRYVGQTTKLLGCRLSEHIRSMYRTDTPVHRWIKKLNKLGLQPSARAYCSVPVDNLDREEHRCILLFRSVYSDLLNVTDGAGSLRRGFKQSTETKTKISVAGRGRVLALETREKIRQAQLRYYAEHPEVRTERSKRQRLYMEEHPEARAAFAAVCIGRKLSTETRSKQREARKRFFVEHPDAAAKFHRPKGWRHTSQARVRMSVERRGKRKSPEMVARMRVWLQGHRVSSETCAKISAARRRSSTETPRSTTASSDIRPPPKNRTIP